MQVTAPLKAPNIDNWLAAKLYSVKSTNNRLLDNFQSGVVLHKRLKFVGPFDSEDATGN